MDGKADIATPLRFVSCWDQHSTRGAKAQGRKTQQGMPQAQPSYPPSGLAFGEPDDRLHRVSSTPRPFERHRCLWNTGSSAFADDDSRVLVSISRLACALGMR